MGTPFRGLVRDSGQPVLGAKIRLVGDLQTLGGDPRAVADNPAAVTWTRTISGFDGGMWNAWQRYVARDVAGLAWEEFRVEVVKLNPSLRLTDEVFQAGTTYAMPENRAYADTRSATPTVLWDRSLTGFSGSRWECWRRYVQGKVIGLSWPLFNAQVVEQNPELAGSDGQFLDEQSYSLPRTIRQDRLVRMAYGGPNGEFRFEDLPPGTYQIEIAADGYRRYVQEIVIAGDESSEFELIPISIEIDRGDVFVRVAGRHFHLGGRSFRFVGVNLRGLVHYGTSILEGANAKQQLDAAREIGAKVVRVFLPHRDLSVAEIKTRFRNTVDLMKRDYPEMVLIVALTNLYGDVGFNVPGDSGFGPENKGFYTMRAGGHDLLDLDWFREGYKKNYQPFVQDILTTFKNEPTIMAWNIGNELKAEAASDLLVGFMHTMAKKMREWDPNHLITTGMISTRHAWMATPQFADWRPRLYDVPWLDFITNHAYHGDDDPSTSPEQENEAASREDDHDLAVRFGKPCLIEEAGFKASGNRVALYSKEMDALLGGDGTRAAGYMPWGFMAGGDNGDGDNDLGVDQHVHGGDWNDVTGLLRAWSGRLAGESRELTIPTSNLSSGQRMFAVKGLNLRPSPGTDQPAIYQMPERGQVTITGAVVQAGGLRWWPVSLVTTDGRTLAGWMAQTNKSGDPTLISG